MSYIVWWPVSARSFASSRCYQSLWASLVSSLCKKFPVWFDWCFTVRI